MNRFLPACVVALSLTALPTSVVHTAEPHPVTVSWEKDVAAGTESLVVRCDGAPVVAEAQFDGSAVEVIVDGVSIADPDLPQGVTAIREGATTKLRLQRSAWAVRSFRTAGSTLRIVLNVAKSAAPESVYTVGVGDVLAVAVYKNVDLSGEFTVAPDGTITMPLVGVVRAVGRTELDLASDLTAKLAANFLVDPQVSVSVKSYQSQFLYVTGAVPRSGRVPIRPALTMRGALAHAEVPLTPGTSVELKRSSGETLILDAAALDSAAAPLPRDGDVLTVLQSNFVSIYGEVRHPNRLTLTPGMTLLQAIAIAEGLTDWASKRKVQILRKGPNGPEEVLINLNQVENHSIPDPPLQAEDVIIVGRRVL